MNESRWEVLMNSIGFESNTNTFKLLETSYKEPHRKYHNTQHLNAVLSIFDTVNHLAIDSQAVELALWFHDAKYEITSKTNEKDSADWSSQFISANSGSESFCTKVHSLIMATEHNQLSQVADEKLLVDIDLSILGSTVEQYDEFEVQIRAEYKTIPWFIYKRKRISLLKGFLGREKIFSHNYFYDLLENKARSNLSRAIDNLQFR